MQLQWVSSPIGCRLRASQGHCDWRGKGKSRDKRQGDYPSLLDRVLFAFLVGSPSKQQDIKRTILKSSCTSASIAYQQPLPLKPTRKRVRLGCAACFVILELAVVLANVMATLPIGYTYNIAQERASRDTLFTQDTRLQAQVQVQSRILKHSHVPSGSNAVAAASYERSSAL
jgi:hypothetical protein